jgi:multisubunit Na+/H+ antiporter MnhC subunit
MRATIALVIGAILILTGFWGVLTRRNMIKMVLGLAIAETGLHLVMIAVGYITGRTAPIIDAAVPAAEASSRVVDPVPQALVLTAIVIGVAINALLLSFIVRLHRRRHSLDINDYTELKW